MTLKDQVWDAIALGADSLQVESVAAGDKVVVYRVTFDLVLSRDTHRLLGQVANKGGPHKGGRSMASALRRIVRLAFKLFLSDEPPRGDG
jgi:hypothetical protein